MKKVLELEKVVFRGYRNFKYVVMKWNVNVNKNKC